MKNACEFEVPALSKMLLKTVYIILEKHKNVLLSWTTEHGNTSLDSKITRTQIV